MQGLDAAGPWMRFECRGQGGVMAHVIMYVSVGLQDPSSFLKPMQSRRHDIPHH